MPIKYAVGTMERSAVKKIIIGEGFRLSGMTYPAKTVSTTNSERECFVGIGGSKTSSSMLTNERNQID